MLPKKLKLPIQEMISKKGKSYKNPFFTIKVFSTDKSYSRFGVIVSKKVGKTAVLRNRIKRMIFNALGLFKDQWPMADYLIITNSKIVELDQQKINEQFISHAFN